MTTNSTPPHSECRQVIIAAARGFGGEINVSTYPPTFHTPYTGSAFTCPHGTRYWVEPTNDQIAKWAEDDTL